MTREEILRLFAVAKNRNITEKAKMKTIKASSWGDIPINFTGIVEWSNGDKHWLKNCKQHRKDGPAIECANGTKYWCKEGKWHREDGPAMEFKNGTKYWFLNGSEYTEKNWKLEIEKLKEPKMEVLKLKNYENKPNNFTGIVEYPNGDKWWYKEGKRHREDGPACEFSNGTRKWYKDSKLHREDGPAIEWAVGTREWYLDGSEYTEKNWKLEIEKLKINYWSEVPSNFTGIAEIAGEAKQWYKDGKLHREDGPAIEWANGDKYWLKEGKWHRENGPAIESLNGHKEWYKNGKCHRLDGPAVERVDGSKFWYKDDKFHRIDGPAAEYSNGDKYWYKDGNRHREDGPAIEWANGDKEWWNEGERFSLVKSVATEHTLNTSKTKPSKMRQVAIRVASRQVIKHVGFLITKTLTQGFKTSDSQKLISWFKSEAGSTVLMVLVGKILPRFEALLSEEYKPLFSEIAEEIEMETMVDLTDGIVDSIAAAMVSFDFNSFQFFNSESETAENVRVETLSAPTVTPWESVAVTPAVHSEIKTATT